MQKINIGSAQIQTFCDENREIYTENLMQTEAEVLYFDEYSESTEFIYSGNKDSAYKEELSVTAEELKELFGINKKIEKDALLGPYEYGDNYAVVRILKCTMPEESYVEEVMISDYEKKVKNEYFSKETEKWLAEAQVTVNQNLWHNISVYDVNQ